LNPTASLFLQNYLSEVLSEDDVKYK
jgi:hypothetical protein